MELEEQQLKNSIIDEPTVISKMSSNGDEKYRIIKEIIGNRYETVLCNDENQIITIKCADGKSALIDCAKMNVESESDLLKNNLLDIIKQVQDSMTPMLH